MKDIIIKYPAFQSTSLPEGRLAELTGVMDVFYFNPRPYLRDDVRIAPLNHKAHYFNPRPYVGDDALSPSGIICAEFQSTSLHGGRHMALLAMASGEFQSTSLHEGRRTVHTNNHTQRNFNPRPYVRDDFR